MSNSDDRDHDLRTVHVTATYPSDVRGTDAVFVDVDWPSSVADAVPNVPLIHQVVEAQRAAARQGTHSTLSRGQVRGGGRKPHKQKGTGRARQGTTRAPQYVGGGIVHGPRPRTYKQRTPKKMKRAALLGALADRLNHDRLIVIDGFGLTDRPSTKSARLTLNEINDSQRTRFLVVLERVEVLEWLSLRNLKDRVHVIAVDQLNTYDTVRADYVIFTETAFDTFTKLVAADTADNKVDKERIGAVPQHVPRQLLGKGHEDDPQDPINLNLSAALKAVDAMNDVRAYVREEPNTQAASFVSGKLDPITVERHAGFALISWPTTIDETSVINLLRRRAEGTENVNEVTLYAGTDREAIEHEDGDLINWTRLHKLASELDYVRLELANETLVWTRPDGPHEHHNRFVVMAKVIDSKSLYALVAATRSDAVSTVLSRTLGDGYWMMDGIASPA
jgi:large subunit ribosomal protein L4